MEHTKGLSRANGPSDMVERAGRNEDEKHKAAWAAALTHMVRTEFHTFRGVQPEVAATDGTLTPDCPELDATPVRATTLGVGSAEPVMPNRITGQVDGGALGPVRFTIVRGPEGLNVVLGLENAAQRTLVELEQLPLQQAIESLGLRVHSVRVTTSEAAGIAFAEPLLANKSPAIPVVANAAALPRTNGNRSGPMIHPRPHNASAAYGGKARTLEDEAELDLLG